MHKCKEKLLAIRNILNILTSYLYVVQAGRKKTSIPLIRICDKALFLLWYFVQCEADIYSQTPTCDGVFSGSSCLTHVSGKTCLDSSDCSGRIGFTLSGSFNFSTPRIVAALATAALRSSLLSSKVKLMECPEGPDLESLLYVLCGETRLEALLYRLQRLEDLERDL